MQKVLLHICCGPCSTHPATLLSQKYQVIGYFYNPNIYPYKEWLRRYGAFKKFASSADSPFVDYFPKKFINKEEYKKEYYKYLKSIKGCEKEPEGDKRCPLCFALRLDGVAKFASNSLIDIFATTLTIGSNKNPDIINPIGQIFADRYGIKFYEANWKKQGGALKGKKISDKHGLYRQHYCGCEFSL